MVAGRRGDSCALPFSDSRIHTGQGWRQHMIARFNAQWNESERTRKQ